MKKFLTLLILFAVALTAAELRLGIISDTQPNNPTTKPGSPFYYMKKSFEKMKAQGVDAVLLVGDLADNSLPHVYDGLRAIFDEVFGTTDPPLFLPIMGNHDYWIYQNKDKTVEDPYAGKQETKTFREGVFMKHLKIDTINPSVVVKDISIIGCSMDKNPGLSPSPKNLEFLETEIQKAIARDPNKPVIVFAHNCARNSLYSDIYHGGSQELTDVFKKYPQVIYFSGHTHTPLEDETSILQGDFTAVATSTMNYNYMGEGSPICYRGLEYPERHLPKNMLYVTIDDTKAVIRRYQLRDDSEILDPNGKPWTLPMPPTKENFVYTRENKLKMYKRIEPTWPENATVTATVVPEGKPFTGIKIRGTAAQHPHFVWGYIVEIFRKEADQWIQETETNYTRNGKDLIKTKDPVQIYGDHYLGLNFKKDFFEGTIKNIPARHYFTGFDFKPSTTYRFDVIPFDNFGLKGKPISCEVTTPAEKFTSAN